MFPPDIPLMVRTPRGLILRPHIPEDSKEIFAIVDRDREHLGQFGESTPQDYPTLQWGEESIPRTKKKKKIFFGIWRQGTLLGPVKRAPLGDPPFISGGEVGYWLGQEHC